MPCLITHPIIFNYRHGIPCSHTGTWKFDMPFDCHWRILVSQTPCQGQDLAPPRSYLIAPLTRLNNCQLVVRASQLVQVASASLNTMEHTLDNNVLECAYSAVTLIDSVIQTSRLASPNPFVGVQLVSTFSALIDPCNVFSVFEADVAPHPQLLPPQHLPPSLEESITQQALPYSASLRVCLQCALKPERWSSTSCP